MADTASDFLLQRLTQWGVKRVYGYPGDGINGIMGAFERAQDKLEFIQTRHEEMAAFMACAHAKYTGEVGVCVATSGPGAIHLLNGLYDAKGDRQPVVAIVGQAARSAIGGHYQQEVDLTSLFKDVASEYVYMASSPVQIRHLVDRAMRIAKSQRAVTCIIVPKDVQDLPAVPNPPHLHNTIHSGVDFCFPRVLPADADLRRAADVLNAGERVAMLIGFGAQNAVDETIEVAERLGAGVAKALLGKFVLPDDLPFVTGQIGLLGTRPSADMMNECDTLLMVGTTFPYAEFLPKEGKARGVQIDIDPRMLGIRYPTEVNLVGDAGETLRVLLPLLERKTERAWRSKIESGIGDWWKLMADRALESADPLNPERVFYELSPRLPDNCIISGDAGTATNWFARYLKMRPGMKSSLSGSLATMGSAVPYAVAAKFAYPQRVSIAVTGDGAMQMNGLNVLITVKKYWQRWADPRLIFLVLNNRELSQVSWEMRVAGEPKFSESQDLPDFPYAEYADSIGLKGIRVSRPEDVGPAWEEALHADRPVVYEAYTDPNVATLPPHISLEEARAFMSTVLKGDPDEGGIIKQSVKQMLAGILPHKPDHDAS
ncbi:MAG: thiamine pyrophosphate-requiring protein [Candidatus Eremiobacteraeota bacterium]|nr:thiamine pyrophosphate-requiring protein [Candidatus Eremiobacteraeota bacterium]MBC5827299.1 thiamine pyrophosphate-requiring protein [Candidatus Eremiobacteraeota bacterium]